MSRQTRRRFLALSTATGVVVTTGCLRSSDDDSETPESNGNESNDPSDTDSENGGEEEDIGSEGEEDENNEDDTDQEEQLETPTPVATRRSEQHAVDAWNSRWAPDGNLEGEPSELWRLDIPHYRSFLTELAVSDEDIAYAVNTDRFVQGIDLSTGEFVYDESNGIRHPTTPVTSGDSLLTAGEIETDLFSGVLLRQHRNDQLDRDDSENEWRYEIDEVLTSGLTSDGRTSVFGSENGTIYAHDINQGEPLWDVTVSATTQVTGHPALTTEYVVSTTSSTVYCLDRTTGNEVWSESLPSTTVGSPIGYGEFVIVPTEDSTIVYESETGDEIWRAPTESSDTVVSVAGDTVHIVDRETLILSTFDIHSGSEDLTVNIGSAVTGSHVVAGDEMYIPTEIGVKAFSLTTGEEQWTYETPEPITGEITIAHGRLLVNVDGTIFALGTNDGED